LVIFGTKECYFSDCTNKKTKKLFLGYKSASFLIAQTNKQKKEPPKKKKQTKKKTPQKKTKKNTHTIVGREKWLLYFQV
jgi:hypothetical protein